LVLSRVDAASAGGLAVIFWFVFPAIIATVAGKKALVYGFIANTVYWIWYVLFALYHWRYFTWQLTDIYGWFGLWVFMVSIALVVCMPFHFKQKKNVS
jgi:hypothetical protein